MKASLSKLSVRHWFLLMVVLPTLLSAFYLTFIASGQYASQSRFVVKSVNEKGGSAGSLASLVQTTGLSAGQEQTNQVLDYIRSRDGLRDLERSVGFKKRYSTEDADFIAGYPLPFQADKFENLFKYYKNMVDVHVDDSTGNVVLNVKAFTSKDAQQVNSGLLSLSEALVNRLNARAEDRAITEANAQLRDALARVEAARLAMGGYRNSQDLVDPEIQATGVLEISSKLVSEQAALRAQLQAMEINAPKHPSISSLRARISAIDAQIQAQDGRVTGTRDGIASKIGGYENRLLEQKLAEKNLEMATASLQQARTEAAKQKFYLERIVEPDAPDLALYPAILRTILVVFGVCVCVFLIAWMLVIGVLEHSAEDA